MAFCIFVLKLFIFWRILLVYKLYVLMSVSKDMMCNLFEQCFKRKDFSCARKSHALVISNGFDNVIMFSNQLIRLFASFGSLFEANIVFSSIPNPTVLSWEAAISAHVVNEQREHAILLFNAMQAQGIKANPCIFLALLKGCDCDVRKGRIIYDEVIRCGFDTDKAVVNNLMHMFAKSGNLNEAQLLFEQLPSRDIISFSTMITGYTFHGQGLRALELFQELQESSETLDKVTFIAALTACSSEAVIKQGRLIHDSVIRSGIPLDVVVGSALLDMYAKCGNVKEARQVFDLLSPKNVISWSAMIAGYAQHGDGLSALKLYDEMILSGLNPDKVTFVSTLKACGNVGAMDEGRYIHDQIVRLGFQSNAVIGSALITMYAECGSVIESHKVFNSLPSQDVVVWSALIAGYAQHNDGESALQLFGQMQTHEKTPNDVTLISVLKACGIVANLKYGRTAHDTVIRRGFDSDIFVCSAVVDMYCKCGGLEEAQKGFDSLPSHDIVLWGSLISGYAQQGYGLPALLLFEKMQKKDLKPSNFIFASVLKACGRLGALEEGSIIYDRVIKNNLESDIVVGNTLVDMYSGCERLEEGRKVFDSLLHTDIVSWNAMIGGYTRNRYALSAIKLFSEMQQSYVIADNTTFSSVLKASSLIGALEVGRQIHSLIGECNIDRDVIIGTSLIDMYATCGALDDARNVFDTLTSRNWVSWCALIAGYAQHEKWNLALSCVHEMQQEGLNPDERIHTLMLTACSHLGDVEEGNQYFKCIQKQFGSIHSLEHLNCMIDLFGRTGKLHSAVELLKSMPTSLDIVGWMSLLTACKKFNHAEVGGDCFNQIIDLDLNFPTAYIFMSNIYADTNMLSNSSKIQSIKRFSNAWKQPGKAYIEIGNEVYEFVVGDQTLTVGGEVLVKVDRLTRLIEAAGYMPKLDAV